MRDDNRTGQFDFLEKIGSNSVGLIYMLIFFKSYIDLN
jgi:hypothetical protein